MTSPERLQALAAANEPRAGMLNLFFLAPGEGVTDLLLIRHAQIEAQTLSGDQPLTQLGEEQARVLARYLARSPLHGVYASPALRARQTAGFVAEPHGLAVETVPGLRDVDQKTAFDRPLPEILAETFGADKVEAILERMRREMTFDALSPLMEPSADFRGRITAAIDGIAAAHPGERIAIVTHSPVIAAYAAGLLGSPRDFIVSLKLTSITRVLAQDDRRTLDYLNATPHFEAPSPGLFEGRT